MFSNQVNADGLMLQFNYNVVLTEKLENTGVLNELKAKIRTDLLPPMEGKINLVTLLNHIVPHKNSSMGT